MPVIEHEPEELIDVRRDDTCRAPAVDRTGWTPLQRQQTRIGEVLVVRSIDRDKETAMAPKAVEHLLRVLPVQLGFVTRPVIFL